MFRFRPLHSPCFAQIPVFLFQANHSSRHLEPASKKYSKKFRPVEISLLNFIGRHKKAVTSH